MGSHRRGLKCIQGKPSQFNRSQEGEEFYRAACKMYGAAAVVMAFDEQGQADTFRKIEICSRSYEILVDKVRFIQTILFDPNIFAIGTGIEEHKIMLLISSIR